MFIRCSLSMSLVTLVYMAMVPFLAKKYAAKWLYIIWWVITIGWLVPVHPHIVLPFAPVRYAPTTDPLPAMSGQGKGLAGFPISTVHEANQAAFAPYPVWRILAVVWLTGALIALFCQVYRHIRFMNLTRRWSEPVTDPEILGAFENMASELNIKTGVRIKFCHSISSPMLTGLIHPVILLPRDILKEEDYPHILKHELIHFKRFDLWHKVIILGVKAVHWFNPLVYFMDRAVSLQCELSCDERVLRGMSFQQRKNYGETLIKVVRNGSKARTAVFTNLYGGKRNLRSRINFIMDIRPKKNGIVILASLLTGLLLMTAVWNSPEAGAANRQASPARAETLELAAENCNVLVQISRGEQLSVDYNAKVMNVVQNAKNSATQISIRPKQGVSTEDIDMVTLNIPSQKFRTITVNGNKAGISLPAVNADLNLTSNEGSMSAILPKGFNKTIKFELKNGAGSLHIDQGASNYKLSMGIKESALTIPDSLPGYKHGASSYTYTSGNGKAQVDVTISGSAFSVADN
ncbi:MULTISPECIES: M56 family metallopeptidase [Paenibacillus]|uniref:M56 family metallopeptidase n=1 Tax=Paenibacillus TaxID=44249 RepID=UPI002FE1F443